MKKIGHDRVISDEVKARVSKLYIYRAKESKEKDLERLLELNAAKSHPIEVIDLSTNDKTVYSSLRQAAS